MKIEEVKCDFEIIELEDEDGFILNKKDSDIKVTIYDKNLINKIIDNNFNKKYRELLYIIMNLDSDDTTETDTELALIKINDLRNILLKKYYMYINRKTLEKYLNMLLLLEEKVPVISQKIGGKGRK